MNEELLYKASVLKQQSEEVEKGLDFVNEQIAELEEFQKSLTCLEENKESEILASLGKGVYIKAKKADEKLFVKVGADIVVRKSHGEASEIIKEQTKKFKEAKIQLMAQLQEYAMQFRLMLKQVEETKTN